MGNKFLDATGVGKLWGKTKEHVNQRVANIEDSLLEYNQRLANVEDSLLEYKDVRLSTQYWGNDWDFYDERGCCYVSPVPPTNTHTTVILTRVQIDWIDETAWEEISTGPLFKYIYGVDSNGNIKEKIFEIPEVIRTTIYDVITDSLLYNAENEDHIKLDFYFKDTSIVITGVVYDCDNNPTGSIMSTEYPINGIYQDMDLKFDTKGYPYLLFTNTTGYFSTLVFTLGVVDEK